jgi:hypothetical protein
VVVDCAVDRFTVGGTITGLAASVVLQNNGGDTITVTSNGTFAFPTTLASGASYEVTVLTQPSGPTQTCTVTSGTGTVTDADITSVAIACTTNRYTIGGTVAGLAGTGLVLQNNGGDNLTITANGGFTFATDVASGTNFDVTVLTQPSGPTQTCTVVGGTGTVGGGNVTSVTVNCTTNRYAIGGMISGLAGTVVLQNNNGDDLTLTANGTFAFATTLESGTTYDVTVLTQPGTPSQTCVVTAGSGTVTNADVTSVVVTCTTNPYTIGGTVTGLAAGNSITLQNNGADDVPMNADGSFTFSTPVLSGNMYNVTVVANPTSPVPQTCTVSNGGGTVGGANVTNVAVTCTTNSYTIGGTVLGLLGTGLVLRNNGGDDLVINASGPFTFATPITFGLTYNVTVATQPSSPTQTCVVAAGTGSGTVGAGAVTSVVIRCACGNGIRESGEEYDPPPGPFSSALVDSTTCRFHFENVAQFYCNGTCTWAGASHCDQPDADIFCKLRTGNPSSVATAWQTTTALAQPGFACPGYGNQSVNLGPMPTRGVSVNVWYQNTSILGNHGAGTVIINPTCTNP